MARYNEVMEHIAVTEEMESRVLSNVQAELAGKSRKSFRKWIPAIGLVAAAAILMFIIQPWKKAPAVTPSESGMLTSGIFRDETYASARELGRAVGFRVPDFTEVPFTVTGTEFHNIAGIARIKYEGENNHLTFTKSQGTDENSGVYDIFETAKETMVEGVKVTMEGSRNKVMLTYWTDGTYAYSFNSPEGISEEAMLQLVNEAMLKR